LNERIKLPAQEWLGYDPEKGDIHGYTFEQMREFAELIVRECADVMLQWKSEPFPMDPDLAADTVLQHFGLGS
jgi:hypothetical protein